MQGPLHVLFSVQAACLMQRRRSNPAFCVREYMGHVYSGQDMLNSLFGVSEDVGSTPNTRQHDKAQGFSSALGPDGLVMHDCLTLSCRVRSGVTGLGITLVQGRR